MVVALIIGFCFGFFGSIPVAGPIAAIVLKRALTGRFTSAVLIGIGCGIAEGGYAFLAFWGYSKVLQGYPIVDPISRALAALILIGLGVSFAKYRAPASSTAQTEDESRARSLGVGFTITALNPTLIATWTAATATLQSSDLVTTRQQDAIPFALGALSGIIGWFFLLVGLLKRYGERFSQARLASAVRLIGIFILVLGVWFAARACIYFAGG